MRWEARAEDGFSRVSILGRKDGQLDCSQQSRVYVRRTPGE
jgi:hypothetical protein